MSHVNFKKCNCKGCPIELKKRPCRPVGFRGVGPCKYSLYIYKARAALVFQRGVEGWRSPDNNVWE